MFDVRSRASLGSCPVGGEATLAFVKMRRGLQPAPRTLTAAQSHRRSPRDVPRSLAASAKLATQSWRSSRNCRTTDRREHVQPSFHLRDDRADGSAAEATSIHRREAQAAAAHLQQQRQLARCAQVGPRRREGTDARARGPSRLGVPRERARQIWCAGSATRPLRPPRVVGLPGWIRSYLSSVLARERTSRTFDTA